MAASDLEVTRSQEGVSVVALRGEHDLASAPRVREALAEAAALDGNVVVELTLASFIDSSILGAVIGGLRRAREAGCGFAIVVAPENRGVSDTLFHSGLLAVFPAYPTLDEAVAAAAAGRSLPPGHEGESPD
jgi:anti-sigma B factor antagonist